MTMITDYWIICISIHLPKWFSKTSITRSAAVTKQGEWGEGCASLGRGFHNEYISSHPNLSALLPNSFVTLSKTSCILVSLSVNDVLPTLLHTVSHQNYRRWEKNKQSEVAKQPLCACVSQCLSFLSLYYIVPIVCLLYNSRDVTTHKCAIDPWERHDWTYG